MATDPQMQQVLDQLIRLGGKPIETLAPDEARRQPTPAMAVQALLKARGMPTEEPVGKIDNINVAGPDGDVGVRLYTPDGPGSFPLR
jgi:acetyl esterase